MPQTTSTVVSLLGELFQQGKRPNTLLRLIGGFQGGVRDTSSREFPTNVLYQLRAPSQAAKLEGATAPAPETVTISQATNVVQIHQETVGITYLGQSDKTVSGIVPIPSGTANGPVINPRSEEFQVAARMETIQRDVNYSFLNGAYNNPADPTGAALRTRGLIPCITTNVVDQSATVVSTTDPNAQYRSFVEALIGKLVRTNGFSPDLSWTLFGDDTEFNNIAAAYAAKGTLFLMPEAEVAGVRIRRIVTNRGTINLALDPDVPAQTVVLSDLSVVGPVGMSVPGKGIMFMEALAKTGSSDNMQIYGQLGLDHGPEFCHGKLLVPSVSLG